MRPSRPMLIPLLLTLSGMSHAEGEKTETAKASVPTDKDAPKAKAKGEEKEHLLESVSASMFSRFEGRANYRDLGVETARTQEGDATFYRARIGIKTKSVEISDGVRAHVLFEPQSSGMWGVTGTTREPSLGIYQAFLHLGGDALSFEAGRFPLHYGDGVVLGDPGWRETGRSYDGARSRYLLGDAYVDGFLTQAAPRDADNAEGHGLVSDPAFAGDSYLWGLYAGLGPLLKKKFELDGYLIGVSIANAENYPLDVTDPTLGTRTRDGATQLTFGARVKDTVGAFDYRLEGGFQVGGRVGTTLTRANVLAYQATTEIGVSPLKGLRIALEGDIASGDNLSTPDVREDWDPIHPNGHRWLGLMDIIGARTNIESLVLRLTFPLGSRLNGSVDGHVTTRLSDNGVGQVGPSRLAGYEIDSQLFYPFGKAGQLRGLYGAFIPGKNHYASDVVAHYVEAEVSLKF